MWQHRTDIYTQPLPGDPSFEANISARHISARSSVGGGGDGGGGWSATGVGAGTPDAGAGGRGAARTARGRGLGGSGSRAAARGVPKTLGVASCGGCGRRVFSGDAFAPPLRLCRRVGLPSLKQAGPSQVPSIGISNREHGVLEIHVVSLSLQIVVVMRLLPARVFYWTTPTSGSSRRVCSGTGFGSPASSWGSPRTARAMRGPASGAAAARTWGKTLTDLSSRRIPCRGRRARDRKLCR